MTRRLLTIAFISGLFLVSALPLRAAEPASPDMAGVRAAMQKFIDEQEITGAVTLVGRTDGILSIDAVGSRDLESKKPMPKDALFRIASMTKPITAIGIMILVEEGKLAVDDPVEKHLPEFKGQMLVASKTADAVTLKKPARPITLRDLLTHTSGLPGGMPPGLADLYAKRNHTLAEAIMAVSQRPLDFEPGSKWSYCNAGIDTLGRVIEVASGQPYEEFLKNRIFTPLGMVDTTFYPTEAQLERVAHLYEKKEGNLVPAKNPILAAPPGSKYPVPAGGLYSTAADLSKVYRMMLGKGSLGDVKILSPESVATMTKLQTGELATGFTPGMGWGLGWSVVREPQGITEMLSAGTFGHGGAFGTQAWVDPNKDLFLVLLIQRAGLPNSDGSKIRHEFQAQAVAALKK